MYIYFYLNRINKYTILYIYLFIHIYTHIYLHSTNIILSLYFFLFFVYRQSKNAIQFTDKYFVMFTYRVVTPLRLTRQCDGNEATISTHLKFICSMVYETTYSLIGLLYYIRRTRNCHMWILDDLENEFNTYIQCWRKFF